VRWRARFCERIDEGEGGGGCCDLGLCGGAKETDRFLGGDGPRRRGMGWVNGIEAGALNFGFCCKGAGICGC
jgi:hypothetical protein